MFGALKAYRGYWSRKKWAGCFGALLSLIAGGLAAMIAVRNEQRGIHDYLHIVIATVLLTVSLKYAIDRLTL